MRNEYNPDLAIPPGETLNEMLVCDFANRCDMPQSEIEQIISGDAPITPEIARTFGRITQMSAQFWTNLEKDYRNTLRGITK